MFDCNHFLQRNGWRQRDLAERLGLGTSTVGMWCSGKSTPPYDVVVKLINLGITPEELFGEEINEKLKAYYLNPRNPQVPANFDNEAFRGGIESAKGIDSANRPMTKEEIIQMIMDLKAKGEI